MTANMKSNDASTALKEAADWFARLNDEGISATETTRWRQWLKASNHNQRAWEKVEAIDGSLRALNNDSAKAALNTPNTSRRRWLKRLASVSLIVPAAGLSWKMTAVRRADYSTAVGSMKELTLADGSQLWLNTDSALNVHFSARHRTLELLHGEVAIRTASDPRPFVVNTGSGSVRPLGTYFTLRDDRSSEQVEVQVYGGRVEVQPAASGKRLIIEAGQQARFNQHNIESQIALPDNAPSWTKGVLISDGLRLDEFLKELGRYRPGHLSVADDVAHLRLIGAYPLKDTDRILTVIEETLPVRIVQITPWWVRVKKGN